MQVSGGVSSDVRAVETATQLSFSPQLVSATPPYFFFFFGGLCARGRGKQDGGEYSASFQERGLFFPFLPPLLEARPRPREGGLGLDRGGPGGAAAEGQAVRDKSKNEMAYFPLSPFFSLAFQVFQPYF